jgi:hypothetical protein
MPAHEATEPSGSVEHSDVTETSGSVEHTDVTETSCENLQSSDVGSQIRDEDTALEINAVSEPLETPRRSTRVRKQPAWMQTGEYVITPAASKQQTVKTDWTDKAQSGSASTQQIVETEWSNKAQYVLKLLEYCRNADDRSAVFAFLNG